MDIWFHFDNYTLSNEDLLIIAFASFVTLGIIGTVAKFTVKRTKTLAWVVSYVNSLSMSVYGIIYMFHVIRKHPQFLSFGPDGRNFYEEVNNANVTICIWFASVNVFDLFFGLAFYPNYLSVLTTYIHHSIFTWACITFATGHGLFFRVTPTPGGFSLCLLEEIPTFLLASGSVFPSTRTDIGFGITFFLFRICFHFYLFAYAIYSQTSWFAIFILSLSSILHSFWFVNWISKYGDAALTPGKSRRRSSVQ